MKPERTKQQKKETYTQLERTRLSQKNEMETFYPRDSRSGGKRVKQKKVARVDLPVGTAGCSGISLWGAVCRSWELLLERR